LQQQQQQPQLPMSKPNNEQTPATPSQAVDNTRIDQNTDSNSQTQSLPTNTNTNPIELKIQETIRNFERQHPKRVKRVRFDPSSKQATDTNNNNSHTQQPNTMLAPQTFDVYKILRRQKRQGKIQYRIQLNNSGDIIWARAEHIPAKMLEDYLNRTQRARQHRTIYQRRMIT
jgi:hypothetical protein